MRLSNGVSIFDPVYWYFIYLPAIAIILAVGVTTIKIRAEIAMCKTYYKELPVWDCYWAPKFLPQKSGNP